MNSYKYKYTYKDGGAVLQIREIRVRDILRYFAVPLVLYGLIWALFALTRSLFPTLHVLIPLALAIAFSYLLLRNFLIGCVLVYKAIAPMSVRDRCRFEPSCSTYMVMALKKYGAARGLVKGLRRITRCHPPNGGIDLP